MNKEEKNSNKCPICGRPSHKESKYCIFHAIVEEKTEEEFIEALKEYIQEIKEEDKDYDFERFIFIGDMIFEEDLKINIFKNTNFKGATFEGEANFNKINFKGDTNFGEVTFKGDTNFWEVIFYGCAYFNKINFKGDTNFEEVTFKGDTTFWEVIFYGCAYFNKINFKGYTTFGKANFVESAYFKEVNFKGDVSFEKATFKGYADFEKATFKGGTEFEKAIFKGDADFEAATFERGADFKEVTFKGDGGFEKVTFKGYAAFRKTIFKGYVEFEKAIFVENADFKAATFEVGVDFEKATFKGYTDFEKVTFKGGTEFEEVTFKGNVDFDGAIFGKYADFLGTTFEGDANFKVKSFIKYVIFKKIRVSPGKKLYLKVANDDVNIYFERAYLENVYLDIDLVEGIFIDFTDALLKNTKMKRDQIENHILQEEERGFSEAKQVYLLLKNNFHSIGRYNDESWAFKKEKDMERLSYSFYSFKKDLAKKKKRKIFPILKWMHTKDFKKWIISAFSNMIYGYGERPWNVVRTAIVIVFMFTLLFSLIGIGNPEIIELTGTVIHQTSKNIVDLASKGLLKNNVIRNFPDSLYFSLVTFTTLGYGDFRPLEGWGRILAGSEAFIGAFMMALFVYTFARRTGGR